MTAGLEITAIVDDTGISATDGITRDQTLVISGTAPNASRIEVLDGTRLLGTTTADGAGNWVLDATGTVLGEGPHALTARIPGDRVSVNTSRVGTPSPLESDPGWGGGSDRWEIVDGLREYSSWAHGLAFTDGGVRQATVDLGQSRTVEEIIIWQHGMSHVPADADVQYWDGTIWVTLDAHREFGEVHVSGQDSGYSDSDRYTFSSVTAQKLRYTFDNRENNIEGTPNTHGWIYEFEVFTPAVVSPSFEALIDTTPPTVQDVVDVTTDPRFAPVSTVDVVFSEPIDLATFTSADLVLTRDGSPVELTDAVTAQRVSGSTYRITGLEAFTETPGSYVLTVNAAGIMDRAGNAGVGSAADAWTTSPRLTLSVTTPNVEGQSTALIGTIHDPAAVSMTVQVNWGDGSAEESFVLPAGAREFNLTHRYLDDGSADGSSGQYTITAALTENGLRLVSEDLDGGSGDQRGMGIALGSNTLYVAGEDAGGTAMYSGRLVRYTLPAATFLDVSALSSPTGLYGIAVGDGTVSAVGNARPPAYGASDGAGDTEGKTLFASFNLSGTLVGAQSENLFPYRGAEGYSAVIAVQEDASQFFYAIGAAEAGWGNQVAILVKYDADGTLIWNRVLGNLGWPNGSWGAGLAVLNGDIYVSGGIHYPYTDPTAGRTGLWKYSPAGDKLWERSTLGYGGVVTAAGNSIYVANSLGLAAGLKDVEILKYDEAGVLQWSRTWGGAANDEPYGVATDGTRVYITGETASFGTGAKDLFLLEVDADNGTLLSANFFGGAQDDAGRGVAIRGSDVYVVGESRSFAQGGNAVGENDVLLLRYTLNQTPERATTQATVNNVAPTLTDLAAAAIDASGTTRLTGRIMDPGTQDSFALTVNWGDSLSPNTVETHYLPAGTTVFSLTHQYSAGGGVTPSAISVVVVDDDMSPTQLVSQRLDGGSGDQVVRSLALGGDQLYVAGETGIYPSAAGMLLRYPVDAAAGPQATFLASGSRLWGIASGDSQLALVGDAVPPAHGASDGVGDKERKVLIAHADFDGTILDAHSENFFPYRGAEQYDAVVATQEGGAQFFYAAGEAEATWGNFTAVLAKYTAEGTLVWTRLLGNTATRNLSGGFGIAELNGSIYVSGVTWYPSTNPAAARAQLWKYSPAGELLWERSSSGFGGYVTGARDSIYLASPLGLPADPKDVQIQKYDEAGGLQWSRTWGGTGNDEPYGLTTDGIRLFVTGETNSFGAGGKDLFLLEMDADSGALIAKNLFGGERDDRGYGVAIRGNDLYVVGDSRSFAGGGNAVGESDTLLLRYALDQAPAAAVVTVDSVTPPLQITAIADDTGVNGVDGITQDPTLIVSGTAPAGSVVELLDGTRLLGRTTANGAGTWSFDARGTTLAPGPHALTARIPGELLSVNAAGTGYPSPAESDQGWGGGANPWQIVDGQREYPGWDHGLAFTGGSGNYGGEPAGPRQATLDFGQPVTFSEITVWHHGLSNVPAQAEVQYWDGAAWQLLDADREFGEFHVSGTDSGYSDSDRYSFSPVMAQKVRYVFDNRENNLDGEQITHGWIYEFEAAAPGVASSPFVIVIDSSEPAAPEITGITTDSGLSSLDGLTSDDTLIFSGTSEAGSTVALLLGNATIGTSTANAAGVWSFDHAATRLAEGTYEFRARGTDLAGNTSPESSVLTVVVDTTAPSTNSLVRQTPVASSTNADTLVLRATFSEAVTGVTAEDFEVQGATTATVTCVTPITASTYDVTVSGGDLVDFLGTVGLNVANGQNILDLAGNALPTAEPRIDETYTVTNGDVTVSIPDDLLGAPGVSVTVPVRFAVNNLAGVTISGFDIVIEFDATKFSVGSAQLGALLAANSDLSGEWSAPAAGKLIYSADATIGSELFAYGTQGDLFTIVFDVAGDAPAGDWPLNLLASFGETPTAVFANDYADLRLLPGPTNASDDDVDGRMTIDATPPTLAVNIADLSLSDEDNRSSVTFTFSEAVTGFTADDVTVAGSTLSDFAGSGSSYSATFTADDGVDAAGSVSVAAGSYTDVAGNPGGAGADTVAIDTLNPTLAVVSPADGSLGVPRDTHLVVTLDEAIRKGTGTIVVRNLADGSAVQTIDVSSPAVSVDGPTATIDLAGLLASSANYYVEVAAGAFEDLAGNDFAGISGPTAWNFNTNFIVTGLTATSTGFHVRFSQDLDVSQLNLYDQGNLLGAADMTLIGATVGKVRGSFVVGPGSREATFIKTSGLLPPDQYTVTLTSAATAFRDVGGALLDGDGNGQPGGDFVNAFAVSAPAANAITVSLPNITRGYGQPVNLPANVLTAGLPVQLSDGFGLSGLDLELRYNPSLLNITGFTLDSGVTARGGAAQLTFPSAGVARLTVDTTGSLGATSGLLTLGSFTAAVPNDALYGAKHVLDISNLRVYDNGPSLLEVPSIDDDAIHVAAYFGDTNGSGFYNSPDSGLVRRIIGQLNTGLAAYALADPVLIADITLNGIIQSNDTTGIRRATGGIPVPNIPALPTGLGTPAIAGADPKLTIPRNLAAAPGTTLTVPVVIEVTEPAGVTIGGFDIGIEFDPDKFTVSQARLGDLSQGTDLVGVMTQPSPGRLVFSADSLVGTTRFPFGTVGHLVTLTVTVAADAAPGLAAFNLLATLGLGRTGVFDANLGELVLNPAPTNAASDPVDGLVTIGSPNPIRHNAANPLDANGDGLVTALDALVVINSLNAALEDAGFPNVAAIPAVWCDVNNDQVCTALDVLLLVNHLNTQASSAAEGEPSGLEETPAAEETFQERLFADLEAELSPFEDILSQLADDVASAWR